MSSSREKHWAILWLEYSRVGYVEALTLFGLPLYRRCGSLVEVCGIHWRVEN